MEKHKQFFTLVATILIVTFTLTEYVYFSHYRGERVKNIQTLADQVRSVLMSTRRVYHKQFINSGIPLTNETLGFLPAHALPKISKDFSNWSNFGLQFNNVSDRPRNPENKADAIELKAIEFFNNNRNKKVRFVSYKNNDGEEYYHYSRPIWIEKYCLKCHGSKEDAPITIRNNYNTSFDYQVGDLRGIMSIKIPYSATKQIAFDYLSSFYFRLMIFFLMCGLLYLVYRNYLKNQT